jgi:hypothetical protein
MVRQEPASFSTLSTQSSVLSTFYYDEQLTVMDFAHSGGGAA